jgi:hypothetical protein
MESTLFTNPIVSDLINAKSFAEFEQFLEKDPTQLESLLFDLMPQLINSGVETFNNLSERMPFIYSSMAALSSLMTDVQTRYADKPIYPMLYFALVGPAGSNKGIVKYASKMLRPIHQEIKQQSEEAFKKYKAEHRHWVKAVKEHAGLPEPQRPPYSIPIVSADITKSKLIQQIADNVGLPTFIITDEIDTLVGAARSQYGTGISAMLRSAYHHDPISQQLKSDNQHYDIEEPKVALCIAGTPSQMLGFIDNVENGLYSRFTILLTDDSIKWNSVAPCPTCPNREDTFNRIGRGCLQLFSYLNRAPIEVEFTQWQWDLINSFGEEKLGIYATLQSEYLGSVVKRHSLMIVKLAMVITILKAFETNNTSSKLYCDKEAFVAAMILIRQSLYCSIEFFEQFNTGKKTPLAKSNTLLITKLPTEFSRYEAVSIATAERISERTLDRALEQLVSAGLLIKNGHGKYKKTDLTVRANVAN